MERLTVKRKDGRWALANSADASNLSMMDKIPLAIDRLATYEDAEEQGLLIRLPCKVGDILFVTDEGTLLPAARLVTDITWNNGKVLVSAVNQRTLQVYHCTSDDFGKTVFLAREEAEAALKGDGEDV